MFCNMLASSLDTCGCCIGLQIYFISSNDVAFLFSWWFRKHTVFYNNFHIRSVLGSWLHLLVLCCVQALYGNYKTTFLCWLGADLKGGLGGHSPPPPPTGEAKKKKCGNYGRNKAKHISSFCFVKCYLIHPQSNSHQPSCTHHKLYISSSPPPFLSWS